MNEFAQRRAIVRGLTPHQRSIVHRVNQQHDDGVLRIVSGQTKSVSSESNMTIRAVFSSETQDRYGDIIRAAAFNTPDNFKYYFRGNPGLLWAHGRDSAAPNRPVGTVGNPDFNGTDINGVRAFEGDAIFTDAHQFAVETWRMYEQKVLRAFSVGFRPKVINEDNPDIKGIEFLEVDLLEISAVPIPANPAALRKAFMDGVASEEYFEKTFFTLRDEILVRHADIFVPTDWRYKESLNEMATIAAEIRAGTFTMQRSIDMTDKAFAHNSETAKSEPSWSTVMSNRSKLPDAAFADREARSYPHHWVESGSGEDDEGRWTSGTMYLHTGGLKAAWSAANGAHTGKKASPSIISHLEGHRKALGLDDNKFFDDEFWTLLNDVELIKSIAAEMAKEEKEEYECAACGHKDTYSLEKFPVKIFAGGITFHDIKCSKCGVTEEECLNGLIKLLAQK